MDGIRSLSKDTQSGGVDLKIETEKYQQALGILREKLATMKQGNKVNDEIILPKDRVFARYQPVFSITHLEDLGEEEFRSFLYFDNNRHWSGLYRKGLQACSDMNLLRQGLKILLDENKSIAKRFDDAINMIYGMGKGLASAILTVVYPDKYGVWNTTSEAGMRALGIWPVFDRGTSIGERYENINEVLSSAAKDIGTDLWTLDALWWSFLSGDELPISVTAHPTSDTSDSLSVSTPASANERFILEQHLEDFLVGNWERTDLGRDWVIYASEDDDEAGQQFPTDIGRIDILAKHKREPKWMVVELKRNQTSDMTVGQVLRYMGWVKQHLAKTNETVEGLIIAHEADKAVKYALNIISGVNLMLYEVQFKLQIP